MLKFFKYHGIGNDFIVLDRREGVAPLGSGVVRLLCDRHRGIGADGILSLVTEAGCEGRMLLQNADGSESAMCGNGLRCLARYLYDCGTVSPTQSKLTLAAGEQRYVIERVAGDRFRVAMGCPVNQHADLPGGGALATDQVALTANGRVFSGTTLFLGNPHLVIFLSADEDPRQFAEQYGAALEHHRAFRNRTNVSFVRPGAQEFEVVVHERGVGVTQACGSGASAVAVASVRRGLWRRRKPLPVRLPGGQLVITVEAHESIFMEGQAEAVFQGEVILPQ